MSDWTRDREINAALRDPDERREINLAMEDIRAAPSRVLDILRMVYARGFRRAWAVRDAEEIDTVPPHD